MVARIWVSFATLGLAFVLAACSKRDAPTARLEIDLRRAGVDVSGGNSGGNSGDARGDVGAEWTATWTSTVPVLGLEFPRRGPGFRASSWRIMSPPGAMWRVRDGVEILVAPERVQTFKVAFADSDHAPSGDYPFLKRYSKGGSALFGAHLVPTPFNCAGSPCPDANRLGLALESTLLNLIPSLNERIHTTMTQSNSPMKVQAVGAGWIFFGSLEVREFKDLRMILDPQLPAWVRHEFVMQTPKLLSLFSGKLGLPLNQKPLFLFPYAENAGQIVGRSSGAVSGNQVLLSIEGRGWKQKSKALREDLLRLMAHELFHLWNANLFTSTERPQGAWLHEGAAEAMALRSLADLGLLPASRATELRAEAINRCMISLDLRAGASEDPLTPYHCGSALNTIVEAAARNSSSSVSLYEFWARLFRSAESRKGIYTHEMFFESASALGGEPLGTALQKIAFGPSGDIDVRFREAMATARMESFILISGFPYWYDKLMGEKAADLLLAQDCAGLVPNRTTIVADTTLLIRGSQLCARAKTDINVETIEGYRAVTDGVIVYDFIRDICNARPQDEIRFRHSLGALSLKCTPLPRRPSYLWFQDAPLR